ncbi:MAG: response regulator [Gaiellaceae bacterium]
MERAGEGLRVLVVDDDPSIRLLCRVNLEAAGVQVDEAADGQEALDAALAAPPDVALVDVMMPGLDGWELAEQLRADERTANVAVVFITAMTGEFAESRARELGATYISKPFNPLELPRVVERLAG